MSVIISCLSGYCTPAKRRLAAFTYCYWSSSSSLSRFSAHFNVIAEQREVAALFSSLHFFWFFAQLLEFLVATSNSSGYCFCCLRRCHRRHHHHGGGAVVHYSGLSYPFCTTYALFFLRNSFPLMGWWHLSCAFMFCFRYHFYSWIIVNWCHAMLKYELARALFCIVAFCAWTSYLSLYGIHKLSSTLALMGCNNWMAELFYFN